MTISGVVGGVKHPGSVGGLIADLQIDCSTLWKQLSYFTRPPRICWNTWQRKGGLTAAEGALFKDSWSIVCTVPVHRNNPTMNIGGWDCHHACLPVCHCIPTPWLLISLINHRCEQRTTQLFMLILFLLHPATLRKGSVSTHPLIFPRVIEMSINSHHPCGCATLYGSFPLIHINPASQSTYLMRSERQSFTVPKQGGWCPTCWLQSNLAQPRPIRQ